MSIQVSSLQIVCACLGEGVQETPFSCLFLSKLQCKYKVCQDESTRDRGTDTNAVAHSCSDHFPDIISISRGKDWN